LALNQGDGIFSLKLNDADITVEGQRQGEILAAALQAPPTRSTATDPQLVAEALALFGYTHNDLDAKLPRPMPMGAQTILVVGLTPALPPPP
jgi:hypothetical protein